MAEPVYVLGGYQTDFARNWTKEGKHVTAMMREAVEGALAETEIDPKDVQTGHVGNFAAELYSMQGHLGAFLVETDPAFSGLPTGRHEAACASGSIALLAAAAELEAGRYDCALVLGVELERNVPGDTAAAHLGAAAWVGHEAHGARFVWPTMFAAIEDAYAARWGLDRRWLGAIARQAMTAARANPHAQTRAWTFPDAAFSEDDAANPIVAGRLRRTDCAQLTDGAAGVILASARFAREHAQRRGVPIDAFARVLGCHRCSQPRPTAPAPTPAPIRAGSCVPGYRRRVGR